MDSAIRRVGDVQPTFQQRSRRSILHDMQKGSYADFQEILKPVSKLHYHRVHIPYLSPQAAEFVFATNYGLFHNNLDLETLTLVSSYDVSSSIPFFGWR